MLYQVDSMEMLREDLTRVDLFVGSTLKDNGYIRNPHILQELKANIKEVVTRVNQQNVDLIDLCLATHRH